MKEGKLEIEKLKQLLQYKGKKNKGIISRGMIGGDVAVLDIVCAKENARKFYQDDSPILLIEKSDPITFPTREPGKYVVIVNSNDIACSGALPYGMLLTIIAPPTITYERIKNIQKQAHEMCKKFNISILGGHTEISQKVKQLIISGHMMGFVPRNYLIPNELRDRDCIIQVGYAGAEGTGIIINEAGQNITTILSKNEIEQGKKIGNSLSILKIALELNKRYKPRLIHDATEGGIYGALYEIIAYKEVGIKLIEKPLVSEVTLKLSRGLEFNPYRLISSGSFIAGIEESKCEKIITYLKKEKIPVKIIGRVDKNAGELTQNNKRIGKPQGDEIIKALEKLDHMEKKDENK